MARGALSEPDARETASLRQEELEAGLRLACIATALGDVEVETSASSRFGSHADLAVPSHTRVGIAADIGTTTLTVALVNVESGDEIARASALNPQVAFGADVMSRIANSERHDEMRRLITSSLASIVCELLEHGSSSGRADVAVAGNVAMLHLLAGADATGLGTAPYRPAFLDERDLSAESLGLDTCSVSRVTLLPAIAPFVGADTVAAILATRLAGHAGPALLIDVGTNAEIVLKTPGGALYVASAAAGPAFEGSSIACGMRASDGAIESASWGSGELQLGTVGGSPPKGICGSGLVDLLAALLDAGAMDATGRLEGSDKTSLVAQDESGQREVRLPGGVWLTQDDVRQAQLAKAAVAAAIGVVAQVAKVRLADIEEVLVAGGFGRRLSSASLARIGMLPRSLADRTVFVGDAAVGGASRWLVDASAQKQAREIRASATVVDLATHPEFERGFISSMGFETS